MRPLIPPGQSHPQSDLYFLSYTVQWFYSKLGSEKWTDHLSPQVSKISVVNVLLQGTLALLPDFVSPGGDSSGYSSVILHCLSVSNNCENCTAHRDLKVEQRGGQDRLAGESACGQAQGPEFNSQDHMVSWGKQLLKDVLWCPGRTTNKQANRCNFRN